MTERQSMIEFIIDEIRRARMTAGLTQDRFGRGANFSASQVSAVETGTRALTREYVRGADKALKTGGLFERMVIKLKLDSEPSWLREWIEIERKAESLRWFEHAGTGPVADGSLCKSHLRQHGRTDR